MTIMKKNTNTCSRDQDNGLGSGSYRVSDLNSEVFLGNVSILISAGGQLVDTLVL